MGIDVSVEVRMAWAERNMERYLGRRVQKCAWVERMCHGVRSETSTLTN